MTAVYSACEKQEEKTEEPRVCRSTGFEVILLFIPSLSAIILGKNFFNAKYWLVNVVSHLHLSSYSFYQAGCVGHLLLFFMNCALSCDLLHCVELHNLFPLRDKKYL